MTTWQIEPDFATFLAELQRCDGADDRTFRDALAGVLLHDALLGPGNISAAIADECEVAVSTVHRWARGTARPLPGIRKAVLDAAARLLEQRARAAAAALASAHSAFRQMSLAAQDAMEDGPEDD